LPVNLDSIYFGYWPDYFGHNGLKKTAAVASAASSDLMPATLIEAKLIRIRRSPRHTWLPSAIIIPLRFS